MWSEYPSSISSSLKVISLVSRRKSLSALAFVARHSTLVLEAMLTKASVAILHSFTVSFSWSNKFFNRELFCKVVMVTAGRADLSSLSFPESVQMTTTVTLFPL